MKSSFLKKSIPHFIAIVFFLLVSVVYNKTALEGKVLNQSDVVGHMAMSKLSKDLNEKNGHYPLWTESMFSGMPAFSIAIEGTYPITISPLYWILKLGYKNWPKPFSGLPNPVFYFFLGCICFYILSQVFRLNIWLSILGSISFAYCTFNPILLATGHETELLAISYMPAVIAGVILLLQGKYWLGTAVTVLFFGLQVSSVHLQIIYYTCIIVGVILVVYLINSWEERKIKHWLISFSLVAFSFIIGLMNYALTLLPTREYAAESMRGGKSELTQINSKNKTVGGLDKDYAFQWSYGIQETLTLFVPGMSGGGGLGKQITGSSKFVDKLTEVGYPEDYALGMVNAESYWGDQPFTSGPVYMGAVTCFLFILGMVYVKSWHKWWILSICLVGIVLAWGRHFSMVNYFLFDHLPFYNKFRAPSMSLVMPQLGFSLLAVLGLQEFIDSNESKEVLSKKFKTTLYISGGLVFLSLLVFMLSDFKSENDSRLKESFVSNITQQMARGKQPTPEMQLQATQTVNGWMVALHEDRKGIFQADLIRSTIFSILAAVFCWFFFRSKINSVVLISGLIILSSYDLMAEGKVYLNEESYMDPENMEAQFSLSDADLKMNADPEKNFRVFDQSGSGDPFSNPHASYYHYSIGGYHPAKLALYDDLIQRQLRKGNQMVYNMLNTKYIIRKGQDGKEVAGLNPGAFGSCWLVSDIHFVKNADQEMAALDSINLRDTAVVEDIYKDRIPFTPVKDSAAIISLIVNLNDTISYRFKSNTNQFAVFSEIYYDKGWNAFIDNKSAPYCRVNYVLRGMSIPAGNHTIEFRFEPKSYEMGNRLSLWAAIATYVLLILAILQQLGIFPKKTSRIGPNA